MVESGLMTLATLIDRMSTKPASIARYQDHGQLKVGRPANLLLVDLEARWTVERSELHSKSKNTPFNGMELPAVIEKTFHNGALVYDRRGM
jgi:dihydroorotase